MNFITIILCKQPLDIGVTLFKAIEFWYNSWYEKIQTFTVNYNMFGCIIWM